MPAWLVGFIVSMAIKFGVPFILKRIPGLPPEIVAIIEQLLATLQKNKVDKKQAIELAKNRVKAHCDGVSGCPTEPKGLG